MHSKDWETDDMREISQRLKAISNGASTQEFSLRRNQMGQLGFHVQHDGLITEVENFGYAWQSGLRQGSRLVEINKYPVSAISHEHMVDLLKTSMSVTVTVIPPHPDGTPRKGCNVRECPFAFGSSSLGNEDNNSNVSEEDGDYENVTGGAAAIDNQKLLQQQQQQQQQKWYELSDYGASSSENSSSPPPPPLPTRIAGQQQQQPPPQEPVGNHQAYVNESLQPSPTCNNSNIGRIYQQYSNHTQHSSGILTTATTTHDDANSAVASQSSSDNGVVIRAGSRKGENNPLDKNETRVTYLTEYELDNKSSTAVSPENSRDPNVIRCFPGSSLPITSQMSRQPDINKGNINSSIVPASSSVNMIPMKDSDTKGIPVLLPS